MFTLLFKQIIHLESWKSTLISNVVQDARVFRSSGKGWEMRSTFVMTPKTQRTNKVSRRLVYKSVSRLMRIYSRNIWYEFQRYYFNAIQPHIQRVKELMSYVAGNTAICWNDTWIQKTWTKILELVEWMELINAEIHVFARRIQTFNEDKRFA